MKKLLFIMIFLCGIMLTGCTQLVELTDEESDIIAEYMANVVLEHDDKYKEALIYPDNMTEEEVTKTTEPEAATVADSSDSESNLTTLDHQKNEDSDYEVSNMNLSDEMGNGKFDISYENFRLYDSYPKEKANDYYSLEAAKGKKLLVVSFDINNLSKKDQVLNLVNSGYEYILDNGSEVTYKPKLTLLLNDIQYLDITVPAGKKKEAVLVFEVPENIDLSKYSLIVSNKEKNAIIKLN